MRQSYTSIYRSWITLTRTLSSYRRTKIITVYNYKKTSMKFNLKTPLWILGVLGIVSLTSCNQATGGNSEEKNMKNDPVSITVLQTADIPGQLGPHTELFWENEEIVFKERGGLANVETLFMEDRKKNPGRTVIVEGGDLIQGSGYAA